MKETPARGKWTLHMGCHRGTLVSRDPCQPETHESLEACRDALNRAEKSWIRIGCFVWFATARGPNGEEVTLHEGVPYK